ncbi:MAG: hypothetical protein DRP27_09490 [Thermotogae bacterium]|nr:MAG: hypothetical protein DRP27_09490 [Thermotogota bacterium]
MPVFGTSYFLLNVWSTVDTDGFLTESPGTPVIGSIPVAPVPLGATTKIVTSLFVPAVEVPLTVKESPSAAIFVLNFAVSSGAVNSTAVEASAVAASVVPAFIIVLVLSPFVTWVVVVVG